MPLIHVGLCGFIFILYDTQPCCMNVLFIALNEEYHMHVCIFLLEYLNVSSDILTW